MEFHASLVHYLSSQGTLMKFTPESANFLPPHRQVALAAIPPLAYTESVHSHALPVAPSPSSFSKPFLKSPHDSPAAKPAKCKWLLQRGSNPEAYNSITFFQSPFLLLIFFF
ncbi:hypothetical protein QAD02_011922 [Eretmocerus hayati]|uniref:Uncharacterized protein n=1 Tax=Eretmocerus hayati TaxID=131215 RepID=A0ACC2NZW7_9HYME|nr:hypothetical protein QAD02_011922 [Eretmocerus hayati]